MRGWAGPIWAQWFCLRILKPWSPHYLHLPSWSVHTSTDSKSESPLSGSFSPYRCYELLSKQSLLSFLSPLQTSLCYMFGALSGISGSTLIFWIMYNLHEGVSGHKICLLLFWLPCLFLHVLHHIKGLYCYSKLNSTQNVQRKPEKHKFAVFK